MATIPLQLAQRRLDTGTVVSYPEGSPVGRAMQGFGDELSAVAERYRQMKERQEAFDADIARRRFNGRIAQAEDEVVANAPADGAGLHDAMYGQVDPRTGRVVKSGLFDTLFDDALPNMPESLRAAFASQKEAMRAAGSLRMAARQQARRDNYEQAEWTKVDNMATSSIALSDPNDTGTFEAIRQNGFDLIAKLGNPLARQAAEVAWRSNTAKALVQAMIAQDPKQAAEMLGAAQAGSRTKDDSAEAVGATSATPPDGRTAAAPLDAITYLAPGDVAALRDQANTATAAQLVDARAKVQLAEQNAPAVIASTGQYPEKRPSEQDFVNIYGADEGAWRFQTFNITAGVADAFFKMRRAPNQAIHAELRDFEPGPDGSPERREQYETKAGAAQLVLGARRADPVGYVSQMFPGQAPDWTKVSTPEDFQAAVTWGTAAQQQMGFDRILAVPQSLADDLGRKYVDESVPTRQRIIELSEILNAVRDPKARFALAGQVFRSSLAHLRENAANNPKMTLAEQEAQEKALEADLTVMAYHPARVRFNAGPRWQKPFAALNDDARLFANSATFNQADRFSASMNSLFSSKSYDELLAAEQAETEDAADRAGPAAIPVELLGAFATGHSLQSAGITFTGKLAAEGLGGLRGLLTRSATAAADGAVFGGVDAALNGRDILGEMGAGALWGAGGNVLAEGLSAIGSQVVAKLTERSADAQSAASLEASAHPVAEGLPDPLAVENGGNSAGFSEASVGDDLHLYYMPEWDAAQRAAADLKVKILTEADTVVSRAVRLFKKARKRYVAAGNHVPAGSHVDHRIDLQLGGEDILGNMGPLDASVNTSLGSQIKHRIKHLPHGTKINRVTIGDRSVRDISKKLPGR
ncbi:hypothetical protein ACFSOZ_29210 [Mesorhizobium newzealandense]|uniref:Large polyvalent protein associated domain-containing protein n=1 Tax=Mesorhizobium newzealandense TaxID=1300302 RepID=A0ABW4UG89_9HYPH